MRVTLIQYNVGTDKQDNLRRAVELVRNAATKDKTDLAIMPEMSAFMSGDAVKRHASAEPLSGAYAKVFSELAAELAININLGSVVEDRSGKRYNTSVLFGRDGRALGQYSKIHRFDVSLPGGIDIRESDTVEAGSDVVVTNVDNVPTGFAICYDLRFGELFRKLTEVGARLIMLPSAFLQKTGMDHWEVLIRGRAIETQCYIAAANQIGAIDGGPQMMFGHSMIVDPWGQVIAQMSNREGYVTASIAMDYVDAVRQQMPVDQHRVLR